MFPADRSLAQGGGATCHGRVVQPLPGVLEGRSVPPPDTVMHFG